MESVTQAEIEAYLALKQGGSEIHIKTIMDDLQLKPEKKQQLTVLLCGRLREKKLIKPFGKRDGWYKVLSKVSPLKVANIDSSRYFDLIFPIGHKSEYSSFGFEDLMSVSEGDLIIITGVSNYGKTTLAHSLLAENVEKHPCVLLGSECMGNDGFILPKLKRRLERMSWAKLFNGSGELVFDLLPVSEDYEDYIQPGKINIVDWIGLDKELWLIGNTLDKMKKAIGNGLLIAVLQKKHGAEFGYGQEATEHYADIYLKIDPLGKHESMLTVGKVKEPKAKVTGRMWGFEIVDHGANLTNIREIVKCHTCWGKGWKKLGNTSVPCDMCGQTGYLDKKPLDF